MGRSQLRCLEKKNMKSVRITSNPRPRNKLRATGGVKVMALRYMESAA